MCYLTIHKFLPHSTVTALAASSVLWVEAATKYLHMALFSNQQRVSKDKQCLDDFSDSEILATTRFTTFYSIDSFQWFVGRGTGLSQPVIDGVTQALCKLSNAAIIFTTSQQQLTANKLAFHNIAGLPSTAHTCPNQSASSFRRCLCQSKRRAHTEHPGCL